MGQLYCVIQVLSWNSWHVVTLWHNKTLHLATLRHRHSQSVRKIGSSLVFHFLWVWLWFTLWNRHTSDLTVDDGSLTLIHCTVVPSNAQWIVAGLPLRILMHFDATNCGMSCSQTPLWKVIPLHAPITLFFSCMTLFVRWEHQADSSPLADSSPTNK